VSGYRIEIVYLRLRSARLALRRIAARVRQGGQSVPRADVVRRFDRSREHFERIYRPLADRCSVYDNSGRAPVLSSEAVALRSTRQSPKPNAFSRAVGRALRRAAKRARQVARMHGTPIYIWKDGKVVAIKP
jgi:predicted ABC-type ATPase